MRVTALIFIVYLFLSAAWAQDLRGLRAVRSDGQLLIGNNYCRIALSETTGELLFLDPGEIMLAGPWFEVVIEDRAGLEPWETWKHGEETRYTGGPMTSTLIADELSARATLVYTLPKGLRLVARFELTPEDLGPKVWLTISNTTGSALVDEISIKLTGVTLGEPQDDWFTWPHTLGARFRAQGFEPGQKVEGDYPGFLYMQWLDLFDSNKGLYLGCLDDYGYSKRLFAGRDEKGQSCFGVKFIGCWIAKEGDIWTTPPVQLAGHLGDWHKGADLYRPFAEHAFGPLDPPEKVWERPTAQCWLAHHAKDADLGKLFEIQQQAPIHASYVMKSLNTSVPEGWDGMRGSALDYRQGFDRVKELGGSAALFTFDRAPLMGKPNYADYVQDWICQRRDGSFNEGFRDLMPSPFSQTLWEARVGEAVRWVREFGLDEIHFDTAATTGPDLFAGPSYAPGFEQRPNEVPHYFKALYGAIRDSCRAWRPDFILRAEHCADFFYPEFLTSTAHYFETGTLVKALGGPEDAQLLPHLFGYTLPKHMALQMPSQSNSDFWTYGAGMGYGFHGGGPSWCFNPDVREDETPGGELQHRYRFYDAEWRRYWDFRVGFQEAVIKATSRDVVAEYQEGETWPKCDWPGPLIAVTHSGGGREVTLGQWYQSATSLYGARFAQPGEAHPVKLRVPTKLTAPQVRLFGETGEVLIKPTVEGGYVYCEIANPNCFALEVFEGPAVTLIAPELAAPGQEATLKLVVDQPQPVESNIEVILPAGWGELAPIIVPAQAHFDAQVQVSVPAGIFGRNYELKAVLRRGEFERTTAAHLKVMEPLTVLYSFQQADGPFGYVTPGKRARLTVTCVNNTPLPLDATVKVEGGPTGSKQLQLAALPTSDLGNLETAFGKWADGAGPVTPQVGQAVFEWDCAGVQVAPVKVSVTAGGKELFASEAFPRTRLMDLAGDWRTSLVPVSRAGVGGAEENDALRSSELTPDVWDGNWQVQQAPFQLGEDERREAGWGLYRQLVWLPPEWQGADLWVRLPSTGGPWGLGGTLNLVYLNGWPAGRVGWTGEVKISPFCVFGGWNLVGIASLSPNRLDAPYLFVREAPAPDRLKLAEARSVPQGAFLELGRRPTGQGLGQVFMRGVPEAGYIRTEVAEGGEKRFLYFTIADGYMMDGKQPVEVVVDYLDEGTGSFSLAYDSWDETAAIKGAFKDTPPVTRTGTGEWKTHIFRLEDARFANREHLGADFRLFAEGEEDLKVRRVEVRYASPSAPAEG